MFDTDAKRRVKHNIKAVRAVFEVFCDFLTVVSYFVVKIYFSLENIMEFAHNQFKRYNSKVN